MQNTIPDNPELNARIAAHLQAVPDRVSSIEADGAKIWIKRIEQLGPIRRLQKGNAALAFERERGALQTLGAMGQAVPQIVAQGPDWFAISDCGTPLSHILPTSNTPEPERIEIYTAAGQALAALHNAGFSHGRPNLKDICWDGHSIRFLDFERFATHRNTPKGHAQDLVMFIFNAIVMARKISPELQAAIDTYRNCGPAEIWDHTVAWCQRWRWIVPASAPIRALTNSREFAAIPTTFSFIQGQE